MKRAFHWISSSAPGLALLTSLIAAGCIVPADELGPPGEIDAFDLKDPASERILPARQVVGEEVLVGLSSPAYAALTSTNDPVVAWELSQPGATYMSPHFAHMKLPKGAKLVVRAPDGARSYTYEDRGKVIAGVDGFWGMHVGGEVVIVEIYSSVPLPAGAVVIDKLARGLPAFDELEPDFEEKAICGSDDSQWAKCYETSEPTAYDKSRAVARLLINGTSGCTGWLVGSEGHLMTNEHCLGSASDAQNTNYEFMAEGGSCSTSCSTFGGCPGTVVASSATLVKLNASYDYALVKLPSSVATTYGYLQLRSAGATEGERIYIPQHPAGWGKKIAVMDGSNFATVSSTSTSACTGVGSDVGYNADTQGGSSGSPVIGYTDHLVVALHHCANCPNRGVPIQAVINDLGSLLPADALGSGGGTCLAATEGSTETVYVSADVPKSIPDNDSTGVTSELNIADSGAITSLALSLKITHTYRGDLVVTLISPTGTQYVVSKRAGGSADNLVITGQAISTFDSEEVAGIWKLKVQDLARRDTGTIDSWSLDVAVGATTPPPSDDTYVATDVPISIPDNDATGIVSQIAVSRTEAVEQVKLSLEITHTYRGDLKVILVSPSGTRYTVHDRSGGGTDNLAVTDLAIGAFTGEDASGTWRLEVQDFASADTGTLDSWSITFAAGSSGGC